MENKKLKQIYCNIKEITKEAINKLNKHTYGSVNTILYVELTPHMEKLKTNPRNFAAAYKGIIDTINDIEKPLMDHNNFSNLMTTLEGKYESIYNKLSPEAVETLESIIISEEDVPSVVSEYGFVSEAIDYLNNISLSWRKWAQVFERVGFIYRHKKRTPNIGMAKDYGEKYLMNNNRQKITFPPENKLKGSYFRWRKDFPDEDILEIASIIMGD